MRALATWHLIYEPIRGTRGTAFKFKGFRVYMLYNFLEATPGLYASMFVSNDIT